MFCKIDQGPQGLWMGPNGPTFEAQGSSPPQKLEKARKAGYFSSMAYIYAPKSPKGRQSHNRVFLP